MDKITNANKNWFFPFLLFAFAIIFLSSCQKNETAENPYDAVDYSGGNSNLPEPDPNSITGLHKNIFFKRCANPGCHDGTFEPDFRTVQSTYSTLVYMTVNKKTVDSVNYFNMRVIPNDFQNSFLYERITSSTSDYMPSNSTRLSSEDIGHIKTWIMNGAPDVNGVLPQKPNLPPNVIGFITVDTAFQRVDTIRGGGVSYLPFITQPNSNYYMVIVALDTADGSSATDPSQFTVHKIKCSTDKDDFSSAITINCNWMSPIPFNYWQATINTGLWASGTTVYLRIYVNDGFQLNDAEYPKSGSPDFYKTYYAFQIQ